jgi:hypothetical protein
VTPQPSASSTGLLGLPPTAVASTPPDSSGGIPSTTFDIFSSQPTFDDEKGGTIYAPTRTSLPGLIRTDSGSISVQRNCDLELQVGHLEAELSKNQEKLRLLSARTEMEQQQLRDAFEAERLDVSKSRIQANDSAQAALAQVCDSSSAFVQHASGIERAAFEAAISLLRTTLESAIQPDVAQVQEGARQAREAEEVQRRAPAVPEPEPASAEQQRDEEEPGAILVRTSTKEELHEGRTLVAQELLQTELSYIEGLRTV